VLEIGGSNGNKRETECKCEDNQKFLLAGHLEFSKEYYGERDDDTFDYHVKDKYYFESEDLDRC
jgi:hypothetical protein